MTTAKENNWKIIALVMLGVLITFMWRLADKVDLCYNIGMTNQIYLAELYRDVKGHDMPHSDNAPVHSKNFSLVAMLPEEIKLPE